MVQLSRITDPCEMPEEELKSMIVIKWWALKMKLF